MPQCFFAPVMARKKGKRRNHGRRLHRRSPAAATLRLLRGGERLRGALRGLLARQPVRRVLLAMAAKTLFQVDVPEALAPAALRDTARHCAMLARSACPGLPPRGHPECQATGSSPHELVQVAGGVLARHRPLDDQQALPT